MQSKYSTVGVTILLPRVKRSTRGRPSISCCATSAHQFSTAAKQVKRSLQPVASQAKDYIGQIGALQRRGTPVAVRASIIGGNQSAEYDVEGEKSMREKDVGV